MGIRKTFDLRLAKRFDAEVAGPPVGKTFFALIAATGDVGDGVPVNFRKLKLDSYLLNPVVLLHHDSWDHLPIGRTRSLYQFSEGELVAEFEFDSGSSLANEVQRGWEDGFIRGASIGFDIFSDFFELCEWSIVSIPRDKAAITTEETILKRESGSMNRRMSISNALLSSSPDDLALVEVSNPAEPDANNPHLSSPPPSEGHSLPVSASQPPVSQPPVSQPPASQPPAPQSPAGGSPPRSSLAEPDANNPHLSSPPPSEGHSLPVSASQPPVSQPPASQPPAGGPSGKSMTQEEWQVWAQQRAEFLKTAEPFLPPGVDTSKCSNLQLRMLLVQALAPDVVISHRSEDWLCGYADALLASRATNRNAPTYQASDSSFHAPRYLANDVLSRETAFSLSEIKDLENG